MSAREEKGKEPAHAPASAEQDWEPTAPVSAEQDREPTVLEPSSRSRHVPPPPKNVPFNGHIRWLPSFMLVATLFLGLVVVPSSLIWEMVQYKAGSVLYAVTIVALVLQVVGFASHAWPLCFRPRSWDRGPIVAPFRSFRKAVVVLPFVNEPDPRPALRAAIEAATAELSDSPLGDRLERAELWVVLEGRTEVSPGSPKENHVKFLLEELVSNKAGFCPDPDDDSVLMTARREPYVWSDFSGRLKVCILVRERTKEQMRTEKKGHALNAVVSSVRSASGFETDENGRPSSFLVINDARFRLLRGSLAVFAYWLTLSPDLLYVQAPQYFEPQTDRFFQALRNPSFFALRQACGEVFNFVANSGALSAYPLTDGLVFETSTVTEDQHTAVAIACRRRRGQTSAWIPYVLAEGDHSGSAVGVLRSVFRWSCGNLAVFAICGAHLVSLVSHKPPQALYGLHGVAYPYFAIPQVWVWGVVEAWILFGVQFLPFKTWVSTSLLVALTVSVLVTEFALVVDWSQAWFIRPRFLRGGRFPAAKPPSSSTWWSCLCCCRRKQSDDSTATAEEGLSTWSSAAPSLSPLSSAANSTGSGLQSTLITDLPHRTTTSLQLLPTPTIIDCLADQRNSQALMPVQLVALAWADKEGYAQSATWIVSGGNNKLELTGPHYQVLLLAIVAVAFVQHVALATAAALLLVQFVRHGFHHLHELLLELAPRVGVAAWFVWCSHAFTRQVTGEHFGEGAGRVYAIYALVVGLATLWAFMLQ